MSGVYRNTRPKHLEGLANLTLVQDDLSQPRNLPKDYEYVVHTAADTPPTVQHKAQLWRTNMEGMRQLLQWTKKVGANYFLYCSTMEVYGDIEEEWINEETPSRSPNAYGASKMAAEEAFQQWSAQQTECACLTVRLPGVVGREAKDTFLPRTVQKILQGETVTVHRKNAMFNNLVHVEDLASFAGKWPSAASNGYSCINVASKEPISLEALAQTLMERLNKEVPLAENGQGRPPFLINTKLAQKKGFPLDTTHNILLRYALEVISLNPTQLNERGDLEMSE